MRYTIPITAEFVATAAGHSFAEQTKKPNHHSLSVKKVRQNMMNIFFLISRFENWGNYQIIRDTQVGGVDNYFNFFA